jgi:hypothetical protein
MLLKKGHILLISQGAITTKQAVINSQ